MHGSRATARENPFIFQVEFGPDLAQVIYAYGARNLSVPTRTIPAVRRRCDKYIDSTPGMEVVFEGLKALSFTHSHTTVVATVKNIKLQCFKFRTPQDRCSIQEQSMDLPIHSTAEKHAVRQILMFFTDTTTLLTA